MPTFSISSRLPVTPADFWSRMSMRAVNRELHPFVHMTAPPSWKDCAVDRWVAGPVLFRSVVLLFGFLPVDVHSLRLQRLVPERGFLEASTSWMNRTWQHERTTLPVAGGCVVTDVVTVHSRVPFVATLLLPVYRLVFVHRHRRLKALHPAA